jgi:hypothetical protein
MNIDLKRSNSFNRCGRMLRFDRIKPLRRAGMRSQHVGAFAFVLVTLPFNASAYVLDFHGTTSEIYRKDTAPAVPAAISNATTWDVLGSIEFTDAEAAVINGGSLSINGISLGAFDTWDYALGYSDEGEPPYYANFSISFNSEEYGHSFFSLYSEDYSGGKSYSTTAAGYLGGFPVGGYQVNWISIGEFPNNWEAGINSADLEFTSREVEEPTTPVPEPSTASLAALGLAGMIWLRWRRLPR